MIKVYTPEEWLHIFGGTPEIVIDGNYIYEGSSWNKFGRQPIGKIEGNKIYGKDHYHRMAFPIGRIVQTSDVTKIFGQNDGGFGASPLFYVKGGKVYSAQEYYSTFGQPSAYLKEDPLPKRGTVQTTPSSKQTAEEKKPEAVTPALNSFGWVLLILGIIVLTGVGFFTGYFGWLTYLFFLYAAVGAILSAFLCKGTEGVFAELVGMFVLAELAVGTVFFVVALVVDFIRLDFHYPWSIWETLMALLAAAASMVMCAGITLVCVLVMWGCKQLIRTLKKL